MLRKIGSIAMLAVLLGLTLGVLDVRKTAACHSNVFIIDMDTGEHVRSCTNPVLGEFWRDGRYRSRYFNDGGRAGWGKGVYKFTYTGTCGQYLFDHWEVQGKVADVTKSGKSIQYRLTGVEANVFLYLRKPKLTVKVDPPGSGEVAPYGVGVHRLDAGTRVKLTPRPHAGWKFDHWTVDGTRVNAPRAEVVMNRDHVVIAHFVKEKKPTPPPVPVASPAIKACELYPTGWPYTAKYRGYTSDLEFNADLVRNLSRKAYYWEKDNILILGMLALNPQPWMKYDVMIDRDRGALIIGEKEYLAVKGERDYGLVYINCGGNFTTWVAGATEYGTRAALMWLLNHPDQMKGHILVAVEWVDANGDGVVRDWEIRVIYTLP